MSGLVQNYLMPGKEFNLLNWY